MARLLRYGSTSGIRPRFGLSLSLRSPTTRISQSPLQSSTTGILQQYPLQSLTTRIFHHHTPWQLPTAKFSLSASSPKYPLAEIVRQRLMAGDEQLAFKIKEHLDKISPVCPIPSYSRSEGDFALEYFGGESRLVRRVTFVRSVDLDIIHPKKIDVRGYRDGSVRILLHFENGKQLSDFVDKLKIDKYAMVTSCYSYWTQSKEQTQVVWQYLCSNCDVDELWKNKLTKFIEKSS